MTEVERGNADRRRPRRRARLSRRAKDGAPGVRVHEQRRLDRKAQGRRHPPDRPGAVPHATRRRQDAARRRAGDRPHRQRRARLRADPRAATSTCSSPATRWRRTTSSRRSSAPASASSWSAAIWPRRGTSITCGRSTAFAALGGIRAGGRKRRRCTRGIMYECVKHNVDFLLAGSIRDDGPLPEVITDVLEAQRQMRAADSRRDVLPDDRHHAALDRRRQPAAGLGQGRLRRHQSRRP